MTFNRIRVDFVEKKIMGIFEAFFHTRFFRMFLMVMMGETKVCRLQKYLTKNYMEMVIVFFFGVINC